MTPAAKKELAMRLAKKSLEKTWTYLVSAKDETKDMSGLFGAFYGYACYDILDTMYERRTAKYAEAEKEVREYCLDVFTEWLINHYKQPGTRDKSCEVAALLVACATGNDADYAGKRYAQKIINAVGRSCHRRFILAGDATDRYGDSELVREVLRDSPIAKVLNLSRAKLEGAFGKGAE